VLTIDPARLTEPVREEPVGDEEFPHVYGPIVTSAVLEVAAVPAR
jgi:uncharacterized protein (DUF952 family)